MAEEQALAETTVETPSLENTSPEATEAPKEGLEAQEAPKPELISGKMGTLLRREQQFVAKMRAEKEKIAAEREHVSREKAELEAIKARYAKVKDDPIEALKETGLSYEELTKRILNADTPDAKIEALQQKLDAFERARQEERQAYERQQASMQIENGKNQFKEHIFGNEDKYPSLTLYDPEEVREAAWQVATQYYAKTQSAPDLDEVADFLEKQALSRLQVLEERKMKRAPVSPAAPTSLAAKGAPKTLSQKKAAERAAPSLPTDLDKLSPDERRQREAEYLAKYLWKD